MYLPDRIIDWRDLRAFLKAKLIHGKAKVLTIN